MKSGVSVKSGNGVKVRASMSIEAAMALPLFIFAMAMIISLFDAMHCARQMQAIAEEAAKELSQYAYTADYLAKHPGFSQEGNGQDFGTETGNADDTAGEGFDPNTDDTAGGAAIGVLTDGGIHTFVMATALSKKPHERIVNIFSLGSGYDEEHSLIQVRIRYDYQFPFSFFGRLKLPHRVLGQRRAWIGTSASDSERGGDEGEEERMVFIGRTSTRYHFRSTCHYLDNRMRIVSADHIDFERNDYGNRYTPCSRCGGAGGGIAYLFPSGSAYHFNPSCTAIHAYVQMVPLSEVAHLGACSYCGGE